MKYRRILVIGANGKVGKQIVQRLVNLGFQTRAMVRNELQVPEMEELGAETIVADLEQDFSLTYKNIDAVIFTAGSGSKTGPEKTISVDRNGAIKSMEFAELYGVKRYIMVSAQGAREPEQPSGIQHYYKAKALADQRLLVSGLKYTIFRPGRLLDDSGSGMVSLSINKMDRGETSRANLAKAIVSSINNPKTFGQILEIVEGNIEIESAIEGI